MDYRAIYEQARGVTFYEKMARKQAAAKGMTTSELIRMCHKRYSEVDYAEVRRYFCGPFYVFFSESSKYVLVSSYYEHHTAFVDYHLRNQFGFDSITGIVSPLHGIPDHRKDVLLTDKSLSDIERSFLLIQSEDIFPNTRKTLDKIPPGASQMPI